MTLSSRKWDDVIKLTLLRLTAGPLLHCVVWNDGEKWRAAVDTSDMYEGESTDGKLADAQALADFDAEREFGTFSAEDACNYGIHVYDEGNVLSIVVESGKHSSPVMFVF